MLKSVEGNFDHPEVNEPLTKHFIELRAASPEGSAHVLDIPGLKEASIKFWSLWENNKLMGCGALKFLSDEHGEFKSIRVHDHFRKKGNGIRIIKHLIDEAKKLKIRRISIAEELKYIGTLCVEFFIDRNENLYVNEIAPRVHNSGHLTINAYNISQFENHIRAVCSLEKISLKKLSNAKMVNLIGNQIEPYRKNIKFGDNEFFLDYLKKEIKDKRKMGHITTLVQ